MTWDQPLLRIVNQWAIPVAASVAAWMAVRREKGESEADPRRGASFLLVLLATRLGFALWMYLALGFPSDGHMLYWHSAHAEPILAGKIPGRDFYNGYGPLLPPLQALFYGVFREKMAVMLPFAIGDALAVLGSWRIARGIGTAASARGTVLWILLSPLLWVQVWTGSQDEPLIAGAVVAALWCVAADRPALAGIALALGLAVTKATFVFYGIPLVLALWPDRRRFGRAVVGGLASTILIYGGYLGMGARLSEYPFVHHMRTFRRFGVSVTDGLQAFGEFPDAVIIAGAVVGVVATFLAAVLVARRWAGAPAAGRACAAVLAAHCAFLVLMPGSLNHYVAQGAVFATILLVPRLSDPTSRALLAANTILACLLSLSWNASPNLIQPGDPRWLLLFLSRSFKIGALLFHVAMLWWLWNAPARFGFRSEGGGHGGVTSGAAPAPGPPAP